MGWWVMVAWTLWRGGCALLVGQGCSDAVGGRQGRRWDRRSARVFLLAQEKVDDGRSLPGSGYEVVYDDGVDLVVVNKGSGLLTVAGKGPEKADCLVARVSRDLDCPDLKVAHRLDRDTSGLLALGRTASTHRALSMAFEARRVGKTYVGRVLGVPPDSGEIDAPVGRAPPGAYPRTRVHADGRPSLTRFSVLQRTDDTALLKLEPVTGRSQQLRVHLAYAGWPLLGDALHGSPDAIARASRLCLHAARLEFDDPRLPPSPPPPRRRQEQQQQPSSSTTTMPPPRLVFEAPHTFDDDSLLFPCADY